MDRYNIIVGVLYVPRYITVYTHTVINNNHLSLMNGQLIKQHIVDTLIY